MPYKIDSTHQRLPREKDRRVKLSIQEREEIQRLYTNTNESQYSLAKKFKVSRRTISFIIHPGAYAKSKEQFKERRKDGRYYDKDIHSQQIKNTRRYRNGTLRPLTTDEFIKMMLPKINKERHKIGFLNEDYKHIDGTIFTQGSIFIFRRYRDKNLKRKSGFRYEYYFKSTDNDEGIKGIKTQCDINKINNHITK